MRAILGIMLVLSLAACDKQQQEKPARSEKPAQIGAFQIYDWMTKRECKTDDPHFYATIGFDDPVKLKLNIREIKGVSAINARWNKEHTKLEYDQEKNAGCPESSMQVTQVEFGKLNELMTVAVLTAFKPTDMKKLHEARDSGKCKEISPGLLACPPYILAKDKSLDMRSGNPLYAFCMYGICMMEEAVTSEIGYKFGFIFQSQKDLTLDLLRNARQKAEDAINEARVY